MNKIAVIGAGTMGNGIAHVFAQSGFQVHLIDVSQEALD
ncbi:3-hydroxyacyl-CoA dehydrogenase NAD-binding domain-containing protein, partial [Maribacter sp. UBA6511]